MATLVQPAFPFVDVTIDTSALVPVAQRSPGVVAVVGNADGATAPASTPLVVTAHDDALALFGKAGAATPLTRSLDLVFAQDPRPSKVYGVRTPAAGNYAAALAGLEAADDVTFVCLAGETTVGAATNGGTPATGLRALAEHVENTSAAGNRRIAVAMIDPAIAKTATYVDTVLATGSYGALKSSTGRMILVAARGATTDETASPNPVADAAAAVMGAVAGLAPATSLVLKQVRGFTVPITQQYVPAEVTGLAGQGVIPLIDPALVPGTGLFMGDGGVFSSDPAIGYADTRRVIDDAEARLRAGLIGSVGDARITKAGLTAVRVRVEGILGPLQLGAVIDDFSVTIPLLAILALPENARSAAEQAQVVTARQTRQVSVLISITYGPAVHRLNVTLAPQF
ncbi:hypothetical protein [Amycolatopsis vancoresmycina]|uniref:Uncharacterized protein n=1 Tax=Amycolatopsis vancoresmycina DSM 44592 TaxID=1292037 RepID=R1ID47_9PSEU|nr:hypothetical protein [Amycolatopsis vancoresmycina]EOD68319.1 hypothetical protein H480_11942 [Amycolatopsis vancoresmycina DSM 44592]